MLLYASAGVLEAAAGQGHHFRTEGVPNHSLKDKGILMAHNEKLAIKRAFYAGDEGGIICDITPEGVEAKLVQAHTSRAKFAAKGLTKRTPSNVAPVLKSSLKTTATWLSRAAAQICAS